MSKHRDFQLTFDFFEEKPIVVEPSEARFTSDAGLLPIRQFDERIGLTRRFAEALNDPRHSSYVSHSYQEMVRSRIFAILADYEDQNDHDVLRTDPAFQLIAGRSPEDEPLASQPTLSRFENSIDIGSVRRLQDVFIDQFILSFPEPPSRLTFDVDCFDDPAHGRQQLVLFHGYYDQYQYLPRVITCAENDLVVMVALLYGTAPAALGLEDDLEYVVTRLRSVWPDVQIHLRGDSGMATPSVYEVCERLGIDYTIGFGMNEVLKRRTEPLLNEALEAYQQQKEPQRRFLGFPYQAGSWPHERFVVVKVEVNAEGTNRRAVVTNRPGAKVLPGACYDAYAERGESENRNKELKCDLHADRLSNHRYLANLFRLYLHVAAANLLALLRRAVADPPAADEHPELEEQPKEERRRYHNRRRREDPLGEGHPSTWRTRLIKVAAQVVVRARRVRVFLSGCWPHLEHYRRVSQAVLAMPPPPAVEIS